MSILSRLLAAVVLLCNTRLPASEFPDISNLPVVGSDRLTPPSTDYLVDASPFEAVAGRSEDSHELILQNGLIRRTWRITPNAACIGLDNLMTGQTLLRALRPEARVTIDGVAYDVGGLSGQRNHAWIDPQNLEQMKSSPDTMSLAGIAVGQPVERLKWAQRRHHSPHVQWPPSGVHIRFDFRPPSGAQASHRDLRVSVHYEMYSGIPVMSKWITVHNGSNQTVTVNRFRAEELAAVEQANWVETQDNVRFPHPDYLHVETDFAFGGFTYANANRHAVSWQPDPLYKTQVNYNLQTPCLLVAEPTYGPEQDVAPGKTFEGFRVFELVYDNAARERRGLALRRMYRTIAPWTTENPITHHLLTSRPDAVLDAIDQAAAVGFEAIILSFGSGFNMESTDARYLEKWKEVADYAEAEGVELGAYSLFSSRSVGGGNDVVSPEGQKPKFGRAPAATSKWGIDYFQKLRRFFETTGFDQFENDGPYPGDLDVTSRPPYQKGQDDSRWAQWKIVTDLYLHLRATGVYINQPDYYFLKGGNKTGMGYREVNWSLPRAQQVIHTRQNIYDGTWTKTPSMGWMHVPLAQYHGGGADATIEPLKDHLDHYALMMHSNLGMGVQAHYRGPRLFDTPETRDRVAAIVTWFKQHRDILESDIIHGRRADGRDLDWVLHVNPQLDTKGMLCVYNPLNRQLDRKLRVNLYYTGLTDSAQISQNDNAPVTLSLARDYSISLPVTVPANSMAWYVIR